MKRQNQHASRDNLAEQSGAQLTAQLWIFRGEEVAEFVAGAACDSGRCAMHARPRSLGPAKGGRSRLQRPLQSTPTPFGHYRVT